MKHFVSFSIYYSSIILPHDITQGDSGEKVNIWRSDNIGRCEKQVLTNTCLILPQCTAHVSNSAVVHGTCVVIPLWYVLLVSNSAAVHGTRVYFRCGTWYTCLILPWYAVRVSNSTKVHSTRV